MTTIITTREILYRTLRAASLFMSQDDTRFHLCGVCVEVGEPVNLGGGTARRPVHFTATDGHTIGDARPVCRVEGPPIATTLGRASVDAMLKALRPSKLTAELEVALEVAASGAVTVVGAGLLGRLEYEPVRDPRSGETTKFPPWRQVAGEPRAYPDLPPMGSRKKAPVGDGCDAFCISAAYLGRAALAAKHFGVEAGAARGFQISVPRHPRDIIRLDIDEPDTGSLTVVVAPMNRV